MFPVHARQPFTGEMGEQQAGQGGNCHRAGKSLPGLARTDARNHFVFAQQRADGVSARVTELCDQDEIEDIVSAVGLRKEIDLLNEVQQPGDIHQSEERRRDGQNARRVVRGNKLADTQAEHENDQQAGFKVVGLGGRLLNAENAGEIKKRARDQQQPAENTPFLEADQSALFHQPIKFQQTKTCQSHHADKEYPLRNKFIARKQRRDHHRPKHDRSEQAPQKNFRFGWRLGSSG